MSEEYTEKSFFEKQNRMCTRILEHTRIKLGVVVADRDRLAKENQVMREALESIKWITKYEQDIDSPAADDHCTANRSLVDKALGRAE